MLKTEGENWTSGSGGITSACRRLCYCLIRQIIGANASAASIPVLARLSARYSMPSIWKNSTINYLDLRLKKSRSEKLLKPIGPRAYAGWDALQTITIHEWNVNITWKARAVFAPLLNIIRTDLFVLVDTNGDFMNRVRTSAAVWINNNSTFRTNTKRKTWRTGQGVTYIFVV